MGYFYSFLFPWNFILQGIAIVHFIRRRPDTYWLYIILIGGGLGAIVYIFVEVLPDFGLLGQSFKVFPRRRRIRFLLIFSLQKGARVFGTRKCTGQPCQKHPSTKTTTLARLLEM